MKEKPLTSCCKAPAYSEPLCFIGSVKTRFAAVARCSSCHKIIGDYKLDWTEDADLKAIQKAFNGTSWAMMLEVVRKRIGAPLNFEKGSVGTMVPEGYVGEKRHDAEF